MTNEHSAQGILRITTYRSARFIFWGLKFQEVHIFGSENLCTSFPYFWVYNFLEICDSIFFGLKLTIWQKDKLRYICIYIQNEININLKIDTHILGSKIWYYPYFGVRPKCLKRAPLYVVI